jgi:hypothetical protein
MLRDVSRDTSQFDWAGLWLEEACPQCRAAPGLRCQTHSYKGKPLPRLHAARGWRQRPCPTCTAPAGEACHTPGGRTAMRRHTARLRHGRREPRIDTIWQQLERSGARAAVVRFHGGGGKPGVIAAVTLEDADGRERSRWSSGEGRLPDALAAPIWARYASFRGHPPIAGMVLWDLSSREVLSSGTRGQTPFTQVLITRPPTRAPLPSSSDTSRDTSLVDGESPAPSPAPSVRACERCGATIAPHARPEARYCSKLCRQERPELDYETRLDAPGCAPPNGVRTAPPRCPTDCDPKPATAPNAAARPHPAPVSPPSQPRAERHVARHVTQPNFHPRRAAIAENASASPSENKGRS